MGHINRTDGLEKQILSGKICGTESRGRQRTKYTDSLNNFVTRKESPNNELIRRTDDREGWKAMSADDDDDIKTLQDCKEKNLGGRGVTDLELQTQSIVLP